MSVGFWLCHDDYQGTPPTASGCLDGEGFSTALSCGGTLLLRPYYTGNPTAEWLANKIIEMQERVVTSPNVAQDRVYYQIGNEPNLAHENWQGGINAYVDFYWQVRSLVPTGIKLAWAGMSPGVPGWPDWYVAAVQLGRPLPEAVVAHSYGRTYDDLVMTTEMILGAVAPVNIIIGESNFGPGADVYVDKNVWAHDAWAPFLGWATQQERILATLYFAYTWNADTPIGTTVDAKDTQIVDVTLEYSVEDDDPAPPVPEPPPHDVETLRTLTWDTLDELQSQAAAWNNIGWPSAGAGLGAIAEAGKSIIRAGKGEQ